MKKVFVVGPSIGYSRFIKDFEFVNCIEEADIVVFTGGEDINPELYNCKAHHTTYFTRSRDRFEVEAFNKMKPNQLAVGICRGAQLFCALYGGILVQDCFGHCGCGRHEITNGVETFEITSIHHQMQFPFYLDKKDYDILYWSEGVGGGYAGDKIDPKYIKEIGEPEVVLYHREGLPVCLGVQGHPEMMPNSPIADKINELIDIELEKLDR